MLTLKNIKKDYEVAGTKVRALKGINLEFRKSEFVAVLGQSGCGKTTLLNIIGGLDKYSDGDLVINGISTKKYNDRDWDTYRNHSVGFVFQSYNLIPHQTVLSNVELALTLSGVSKKERRKRATEALEKVGLGDQLNKKPNQMSGGQMQRVAIARAIVNDPEILLADEPTGALDSQTSVQVMEILKEISKDRLIIMVTHNPELAEKYATRTIRLLDGEVTDDSAPYSSAEKEKTDAEIKQLKKGKKKKSSMSFLTALSLSKNNLLTKKGRTFLTSFAGSIGIIGIALILSVSAGVKNYIDSVQKETLSNYPIQIQRESTDISSMLSAISGKREASEHELDAVYEDKMMYELSNSISEAETTKNNLAKFKQHIDNSEDFGEYASAIQYSYDIKMNIYTKDVSGNVIKSDVSELMTAIFGEGNIYTSNSSMFMSFANFDVWEEILPGKNGEAVNPAVKEQYTLVDGKWPESYDETVLIVNERNEISDITLYALGLETKEEIRDAMSAAASGEVVDVKTTAHSYEEIMNKTFRVVLPADIYSKSPDGSYYDLSENDAGISYLYDNSDIELKIVGIIRPNENTVTASSSGSIGYTSLLSEYIIEKAAESDLLKTQRNDEKTDVLTGLPFKNAEASDEEKINLVKDRFSALNAAEKAEKYIAIKSKPTEEYLSSAVTNALEQTPEENLKSMLKQAMAERMSLDEASIEKYVNEMDEETFNGYITEIIKASVTAQYSEGVKRQFADIPEENLAAMFDSEQFSNEDYINFYDDFISEIVSEGTLEDNLKKLGFVDINNPSAVSIYAETFENKDNIASLISDYNKNADEDDRINYTDYVALLMSSITTIIDAISYVLIAFVTISLVVSSIMIGIITYISVLERTKEIGILRSIGAAKRDISRVFNAETLIVGFAAGAIGIGITLIFNIIINAILFALTEIPTLNATLPPIAAVILVLISMFLTFIAGLIPSKIAAKKDPVIALRTE